jgi:hypothetical protein
MNEHFVLAQGSEQQDQQQNDDDQGENASADVHVRPFPFR